MILIADGSWDLYFKYQGKSKETVQLGGLQKEVSEERLANGNHLFLDSISKPFIESNILFIPKEFNGTAKDLVKVGKFTEIISENLIHFKIIKLVTINCWYFKSKTKKIRRIRKTYFIGISDYLEI